MLKSKFTVQSESDSDNLQIIDLPNHIKLIYDYVPSLKSFSLGIGVMVGSREDP